MSLRVSSAPFAAVPPLTMYDILRLRVDVFVVEQRCPYPELDGRDTEPTAVHWWATTDGSVLATCRLLADEAGDGHILGRVAAHASARGGPVATDLVESALGSVAGPVSIGAQTPLEGWYARFGFARSGADYVEDGILHLPMRLQR